MSRPRRVAITGLGMVTALGFDEEAVWSALMRGETGIRAVTAFDVSQLPCRVAAQVDDAELEDAVSALGRLPGDRATDMALVAAARALHQAGLATAQARAGAATILGTGMGPAHTFFEAYESYYDKGPRGLRPTTVPRAMYNALSAQVSMVFGLTGPNYVLVSACASATNALGDAFRRIRDGHLEVALCGGAESFLNPLFFAVWNRLGVLSKGADPERACRPFDQARDGTVVGEGAAVLVLEELGRARERGARVRGEILGYGESSDAGHLTRPSVDGQSIALRGALAEAEVEPADLDYVNAHGTATRWNDTAECASLRQVMGPAADRVPVGSTKSYFGHTLGASGAIETALTLVALERGMAPANRCLEDPDPECAVRLVGAAAEPIGGSLAMKNSFGFGGGNAVLIVHRSES
ncbi:MAG: beta-ketoacyl-[acyl-carrier-protein] synthase family protein [Thermoanaerobaculia bacterium]